MSEKVATMDAGQLRGQAEAWRRFKAGEMPGASTAIDGSLTIGYGKLDDYGFWEFPLPDNYAEWSK